jgi:hypothetical protein
MSKQGGGTETVKVMVRVRPMNSKEKQKGIINLKVIDHRLSILC